MYAFGSIWDISNDGGVLEPRLQAWHTPGTRLVICIKEEFSVGGFQQPDPGLRALSPRSSGLGHYNPGRQRLHAHGRPGHSINSVSRGCIQELIA